MEISFIKSELAEKGYCIIPDVLSEHEVELCMSSFKYWQNSIPDHNIMHKYFDSFGIYKYYMVGHIYHAWYIRTRESIQNIFKGLWETDELIVSFDGSCYISKDCNKKDSCWTHTDQSPLNEGFRCYQGLVSLTENKDRTLVVYEGTHKTHFDYFKTLGIQDKQDFQFIDKDYLEKINDKKRILHIKAGSLVVWDSRLFHQNQYGFPSSEERYVQYVCYFPKIHESNTDIVKEKRREYFDKKYTTTHWPAPVKKNSFYPKVGRKNEIIKLDYSSISIPDLSHLYDDIMKLI